MAMDAESKQTNDLAPAKDLRWNFAVNVVDIAFISLALNLVSQATIVPVLVSHLTSSRWAIGVIPAIVSLGVYLPPLFFARYTETLVRKKPMLLWYGLLGERLPLLLMALLVGFFAVDSPGLVLGGLFLLFAVHSFTSGAVTPAWLDLVAKVIPVRRRGLWFGLGNALGACLGIAGAALAASVLSGFPFPSAFTYCFGLAFVFSMLSWGAFSLNREPDSPVKPPEGTYRDYFRKLPGILRRDRNFRVLLVTRFVSIFGSMATGFFILFGIQRFQLEGATVGVLTGVLVAGQLVMNLVWGILGDRFGHKLVLAGSSLATALAALTALFFCFSPVWLGLVFVLLAAGMSGEVVSGSTITMEFCSPEERPTYVGMAGTILAPAKTLAPLLGSALAVLLGFDGLFAVTAAAALAGTVLLGFWLKEPRGYESPPAGMH
jgi:MFS family permease